MMKRSNFLSINSRDFIHGFFVAAGAGAITVLQPIVSSGVLPGVDQLKIAGMAALAAGLAYVGKKLLQNSAGKFGPDVKDVTTP